MKINGIKVETEVNTFAYDGCHKIYILEDYVDQNEARTMGFEIKHIQDLPSTYRNSCPLKFINNWKLDKCYAPQCEDVRFEGFDDDGFDDYETMEILDDEDNEW